MRRLVAAAVAVVLVAGCGGGAEMPLSESATEDIADQVWHPVDDGRVRTDIECVSIGAFRAAGLSCHWEER